MGLFVRIPIHWNLLCARKTVCFWNTFEFCVKFPICHSHNVQYTLLHKRFHAHIIIEYADAPWVPFVCQCTMLIYARDSIGSHGKIAIWVICWCFTRKFQSILFRKSIILRTSLRRMLCRTFILDPTVSTQKIIEFFFCCVLKMRLWHLKWMNMLYVDWCHHNIYADFCNLLYQFLFHSSRESFSLFHAQNEFLFDWIAQIIISIITIVVRCRLFHVGLVFIQHHLQYHSAALAHRAEF